MARTSKNLHEPDIDGEERRIVDVCAAGEEKS